jgi:hypothetical protein
MRRRAGERWWARFALPTLRLCPLFQTASQSVIPAQRLRRCRWRSAKRISKDDGPTAADLPTMGRTRPSVPAGLLHSRAGLRQFFEPALDLGAGHREILELAVVEPVQGCARGVTLVACDYRCEEAVDETAQARQQNCRSPSKGPGGGGRNRGQHRHRYFLSKRSRKPVSLPAPFLSKACCQHGVSRLRRVRLSIFVLTRFLHANRYPPPDQVRGHASLENAMDLAEARQRQHDRYGAPRLSDGCDLSSSSA